VLSAVRRIAAPAVEAVMNRLTPIAHRIMVQHGLLPDFSREVVIETSAVKAAPAAAGPGVRDLRDRLWASIDNDTSRDLDQLSVAEPMDGGAVKILVAIADVDAVVKRRSAIDDHAQANTTSVYTAGGIFPMLPERLSTDLTSLGENQDRLAMVVEMVVAADGTVKQSDTLGPAPHTVPATLSASSLKSDADSSRRRQRLTGPRRWGQTTRGCLMA